MTKRSIHQNDNKLEPLAFEGRGIVAGWERLIRWVRTGKIQDPTGFLPASRQAVKDPFNLIEHFP